MELPLQLLTSKENSTPKTIKSLILKDESKIENPLLLIKSNNFITLKVKNKNDFLSKYTKDISLSDLQNLNKWFKQFDTIDEVYKIFFDKLTPNNVKINTRKDGKILKVIFQDIKKSKEISFDLGKEKAQIDEIILDLCDKIKEIDTLKKKVETQEKKIEDLKSQVKQFAIRINNQKQKSCGKISFLESISQFEGKSNQKEINNSSHFKTNKKIDSLILNNNDLDLIQKGIAKQLNKKIIKVNLLFRATRDSDSSEKFHLICDNKINTLSVIQSDNGKRFGGFTIKDWSINEDKKWELKKDDHAFLFSLDNKECYFIKKNYFAIASLKNGLTSFGEGNDIGIINNCRSINKNFEYMHSYNYKGRNGYVFTGKEYFKVSELEVFEVIMQ